MAKSTALAAIAASCALATAASAKPVLYGYDVVAYFSLDASDDGASYTPQLSL